MNLVPGAILGAAILLGGQHPKSAPNLVLELAEVPSPYDHGSLSLVFHATGKGDVYFNRAAVRLEIRSPGRGLLKYGCADKRSLTSLIDPVLLHPGESNAQHVNTRCYHPESGMKYSVTAVFDDEGNDVLGQPPDGAIRVTGPIRSNTIATQLVDAYNQPLQVNGASRRR